MTFNGPLPCSSSSARPSSVRVGTVKKGRGPRSGKEKVLKGGGFAHEEFVKVEKEIKDFSSGGWCFPAWVDGQVRRTLASRTRFSFYCMQAIIGCRGRRFGSASTALFPIPLPDLKVWCSARGRGSKARHSEACQKLLHLAILALNFEYLSHPLGSVQLLRRSPARHHLQLYGRLLGFIRASATIEEVNFLGCGRKSPQFSARLSELMSTLTKIGVASVSDYGGAVPHAPVMVDNSVDEDLEPYTSLDPSRLKLSGSGAWQCDEFFGDLFWLVYHEPRINRFSLIPPDHDVPDVSKEDPVKVFDLCRVWDDRGLLVLCPEEVLEDEKLLASRVFNCRKNQLVDRQIGDRRAANHVEGKLSGQSRLLPAGPSLLQLCPERYKEVLVGAVTDRKDFYHQFAASWERSTTNFLTPSFSAGRFRGLKAYATLCQNFGKRARGQRELVGDRLAAGGVDVPKKPVLLVNDDTKVYPCFSSLFQGDHLGVELASEAHSGVLIANGLLEERSRLVAGRPLVDDQVLQGLYIDDFFVISREKWSDFNNQASASLASAVFWKAKAIYEEQGILGSDDKDILDELVFKVVGAEIDSRVGNARDGLVSCGLPREKRLALATLASAAAVLPVTDAFHSSLVGSLVSMLMYRRQAMSCLQEVFKVIPPEELDTQSPVLRKLPRAAAQELSIVAALAPVLASNLAAPMSSKVYATDASMEKGGIVVSDLPTELGLMLWRDADKRGENVPLESRASAFLSKYDPMHETGYVRDGRGHEFDEEAPIPRPLGLSFDFIEICGGSGVVTAELCKLSVVCGPILDLSYSQQYDMTDHRLISWCVTMLEQGRLRAFLVAPPCTTFSPAAYPALRSYALPEGFDVHHPRVMLGNRLAFASLTLLFVAWRLRVFGMGEQPRRSKMRWLRHWRALLLLGAVETWTASCSFGSPHRKEFCFLSVHMDASSLHRPCSNDHVHIPIQGVYTKPSAVYTPGLARAIAVVFRDHLHARSRAVKQMDVRTEGLEDQVSNDLSVGLHWKLHSAWKWKGHCHVNLLETAAALKLYRDIALEGGDVRFLFLCDSHVARSALARGRTSSLALRPLLKQASSLCIGFGLYPGGRFSPTRWNPADHPTRDTVIPSPVPSRLLASLDLDTLAWICSLPKLRRWAANWVRLVLLILPGFPSFSASPESLRHHAHSWIADHECPLDFDATLGYPGEDLQSSPHLRGFSSSFPFSGSQGCVAGGGSGLP